MSMTMRRFGVWTAGALLAYGCLRLSVVHAQQRANPPAPPPPGAPQPVAEQAREPLGKGALDPLVTWYGPDSRIAERSITRITSGDEWVKLWEQNSGRPAKRSNIDEPFVPKVNFDKCIVVAIFQGKSWNSNGVTCYSAQDQGDKVLFRFDEDTYQTMSTEPGGNGGGVSVTAYGIFVLPRTTKPLVIEENVQNLIGQPPIWKERAKFDAIK